MPDNSKQKKKGALSPFSALFMCVRIQFLLGSPDAGVSLVVVSIPTPLSLLVLSMG
jgi:hypothetical protein